MYSDISRIAAPIDWARKKTKRFLELLFATHMTKNPESESETEQPPPNPRDITWKKKS